MEKMKTQIETYLAHSLEALKDGPVKESMYYSLLAPGKRLRPILFLKVLQAYGMDYSAYIDIACSVEMVHTYSLIHDDLPAMDDDDLRRGRKTCHKQFDEATAILAGDALLTQAFSILSQANITDDKKIQCIRILAEASGQNGMIYGQQEDLHFENKQATMEELINIHTHKTGKLITAPLLMAAQIVAPQQKDVFVELGETIGLAYQIQDDILDVTGDEAVIGKKVGSDIENNKSTYVSLLGLEASQELVKDYFKKALECIYKLKINHGIMIEVVQAILKRVK